MVWNTGSPQRIILIYFLAAGAFGVVVEVMEVKLLVKFCVEIKILRRVRAESSRRPPDEVEGHRAHVDDEALARREGVERVHITY